MYSVYPDRLLPSVDKYNAFNYSPEKCFICRRTDLQDNLIFDENGDLLDFAVVIEDLIDSSSNLINSPSVSNSVETVATDVLISICGINKNLTYQNWDFKDSSVPVQNSIEFTIDPSCGYYMIPIKVLHKFETSFPFNKKNKGEPTLFKLKIEVNHVPTPLNISHFEIHFFTDINGVIEKVKRGGHSGFRKEISHIVKQIILKNCKKNY